MVSSASGVSPLRGTSGDEHDSIGPDGQIGLKKTTSGNIIQFTIEDADAFQKALNQTFAKRVTSDVTNLMKELLNNPKLEVQLEPQLARQLIYIIGKEYRADHSTQADEAVEKFVKRLGKSEAQRESLMTAFNAGWSGERFPELFAAMESRGWIPA